jgi:hypothetical protein
VEQQVAAPVPVYPDLEQLDLTLLFTVIRRDLGTDDPLVRKMLGRDSPEQLAYRLVNGTRLGDPKLREELYKGGQSAIAASTDPMIRFAALINDDLLDRWQNIRTQIAEKREWTAQVCANNCLRQLRASGLQSMEPYIRNHVANSCH